MWWYLMGGCTDASLKNYEGLKKCFEQLQVAMAEFADKTYEELKAELEKLQFTQVDNKPTKAQREEAKALRSFYKR